MILVYVTRLSAYMSTP